MHTLYFKYVNTTICTNTYTTSIAVMSENSLLTNLYPTINKIYLVTYLLAYLLTDLLTD